MPIFKIMPPTKIPIKEKDSKPKDVEEEKINVPGKGFVEAKKIDDNTIILDGPLSQVYTQALNKMYAYANENSTEDILVITESDKDEEFNKDLIDYVYVADGKFFEDDGYIEAFDKLCLVTESYKNVYLCIEHNSNITEKVANFLNFAENIGINVISNRERALEIFTTKLMTNNG